LAVITEDVPLADFLKLWPPQLLDSRTDVALSGNGSDILAAQFSELPNRSELRVATVAMDLKVRSVGDLHHAINLVVWVMSQTAVPIVLGVTANYLTAKYLKASKRTKHDPVSVILAIEENGSIKKISLTGPPQLIAKQINTTQFLQALIQNTTQTRP
jgi:hypothetical protein